MTIRRGVIGLLVVVMLSALAGCDLPSGRAGAKCSPVGKGAQDGTYILTCNKKHRYQRVMTIAAGDALYQAYLRAHAPTTTTPPPPPPTTTTLPPAQTSFGPGTWRVGTMPADIAAGTYTTNAGSSVCHWYYNDATGASPGSNSFTGVDFMQILPTDNGVSTSGPCVWTLAPATPVAIPGNGDASYRVGVEAPAGWYHFTGGANCYWEVDSSLRGTIADVEANGGSVGPNLIQLGTGDAELQLRGCGQLTRRADPTRLLLLTGIGDDPILDPGAVAPIVTNWTGYDQSDTTISATLNPAGTVLTVTGAGWTITVSAPTGQTLPNRPGGHQLFAGLHGRHGDGHLGRTVVRRQRTQLLVSGRAEPHVAESTGSRCCRQRHLVVTHLLSDVQRVGVQQRRPGQDLIVRFPGRAASHQIPAPSAASPTRMG